MLGLDVGDKTIGVAVSDGLGLTAQGLCTIRRTGYTKDFARLRAIVDEYGADRFVVGLPKNMDGSLGPQADKVMLFVKRLKEAFGLPVTLMDERLTTAFAQRTLIEGGVSRAKRKKVIDMLAAQTILQLYLDKNRSAGARNAPA